MFSLCSEVCRFFERGGPPPHTLPKDLLLLMGPLWATHCASPLGHKRRDLFPCIAKQIGKDEGGGGRENFLFLFLLMKDDRTWNLLKFEKSPGWKKTFLFYFGRETAPIRQLVFACICAFAPADGIWRTKGRFPSSSSSSSEGVFPD